MKKNVNKETFPVYDGKCLSPKAVHNWVEIFSQGRSKFADDAQLRAEVAMKTVKRLLPYAKGFKALIKRWDKCINVCGDNNKKKTQVRTEPNFTRVVA
jgi:hypothetical protein